MAEGTIQVSVAVASKSELGAKCARCGKTDTETPITLFPMAGEPTRKDTFGLCKTCGGIVVWGVREVIPLMYGNMTLNSIANNSFWGRDIGN